MRSDQWQAQIHGTLERVNSTLIWVGVTAFYLILVWLDLRHVEETRVLRLILSLRVVLLLFAGWHALAVLMTGNRQVLNAVKWAIVVTHLLLQLFMGIAYEPSHIVQALIPLPTILVVYFVVPAPPRLKVTAGVGQTLLSCAMAVGGLGISRDAALILIPTLVLLNAVGIAHMRTHAYLSKIRHARESEIPSWMNEAVSTLPLSGRERGIVVELLKGKTRSEIGETLFISPETVKWHTRRVYRKLGVSTKIELVQCVLAEAQVQKERYG
jgi:DNA-binding CsgD family transcriptional regulator